MFVLGWGTIPELRYATAFASNNPDGITWLTVNFLVEQQSLADQTGSIEDNHSLTETYTSSNTGNAFEFGITSMSEDPTTNPTLFMTAWTHGSFDGWNISGFVSTNPAIVPGVFQPPVGTSPQFGFEIISGSVYFTYNGQAYGFIPASHWPGGFGVVAGSQTYAEVYNNSPGGSPVPTMNGQISSYQTSTGSDLYGVAISTPYVLSGVSPAGFTFNGGTPLLASSWAVMARV